MLARRWYQCRNPIQKLASAQPQFNRSLLLMLRPVPLQHRPRKPVAHLRPASRPYQPLTGKHRTRTISQQPLTPSTILRCDPHARMQLRMGDWKLVSASEDKDAWEIYDLATDRCEMVNLAG